GITAGFCASRKAIRSRWCSVSARRAKSLPVKHWYVTAGWPASPGLVRSSSSDCNAPGMRAPNQLGSACCRQALSASRPARTIVVAFIGLVAEGFGEDEVVIFHRLVAADALGSEERVLAVGHQLGGFEAGP
nr:hypothetical protein [Tanacetum cinerariifolium]